MVKKCLSFHAFFIFSQCGDNDTSVATFVATLVITLNTTGLVCIGPKTTNTF